ncbi:MAG TPA: SusC/RagA family TonB-linked outer membrane protein [Chitinophagales bacterium]|nr:SusC/RagA family TonB-linked outer membrane protein [Chitinophagales bacterium]
MKKTLLLWLFGLLLTAQVFAQNRTLSGTVKDAATGEALIGVNVTGKGTTIGTVTDIDGKYTLELPKEVTTLVFSYIGYTNVEKPILTLKIDADMTAEGQQLEDVVVTAVAIKREKRSLSYSANTIGSEDLNSTATNVFSAIQAKTPGVRINTVGGAMGASNRIVLDGEASFLLGNNALIVVDGIPINNNSNSGVLNDAQNFVDFGNRGNDFDPENVESVTVLKGPAATALYGSRATSGVIMITTKSGKSLSKADKKFNVSINSGITFDKAYLQIKRQDQFGQGYDGLVDPIENFSWGPRFDGVVRPWTPVVVDENGISSQLIRPYSAIKNQLQDAMNTGVTYRNGVAMEGASDKYSYYFSYQNTSNKGIFDNTFYKRHALTANATAKLSDNLTSRVNIQYSKVNQRAILGAGTANFSGPYQSLLQQAVNIPINELRDYNSLYHGFQGYYGGFTANPYFLMNNINNDSKVDNLLASAEIEYKPVDFITLTARVGDNFTVNSITQESPVYAYSNPNKATSSSDFGSYTERLDKRNNLTIDLIGAFSKEFAKKFTVSALGGFNMNSITSRWLQGQSQNGLVVPGYYNLSNSKDQAVVTQSISNYRLLGAYAQVGFSYKNLIFVDYSVRNDWSSTLPAGNNGFFYQSGGLSFVPTEFIKKNTIKDWISYAKVRFNAGTQGKDASPYLLASTNSVNPEFSDYFGDNLPVRFPIISLDGTPVNGISTNNRIGNPNLSPELTVAYEVGADLDILKDYVHLEYTFRHRTHKDLIVIANLPASTGFTSQVINIGKMRNVTQELLARVSLIRNVKDINWDVRYQFAKTNNTVLKANTDADEFSIGTYISPGIVAKEGEPFGTFKVNDYKRDPNGNIIVGANGAPVVSTEQVYAGSFLPDFTMGWGSTFSWRGLSFDVQFDMKQGGQFYSGTKDATDFNGTSLYSLLNDRQPYIIPGSVVDNGDGTFSENTTPITNLFDAVGNTGNPDSEKMLDASYIKLREASVSYTFDKKFFKNVPLSSISIGLVGRNLKFWLPSENVYADPEANSFGQSGNEQGIEFPSYPSVRSVGFDVRIKF